MNEKLILHIMNIMKSVTDKFNNSMSAMRYRDDIPDQCGIILMNSRNDEEDISGEVEWECIKLEVPIPCENSQNSIFGNCDILRQFVDAFESSDSSIDGLEIVWAKHLGGKVQPCFSKELQVYKCVIDINYKLE